jgi:hypothetical protein
MVATTEAMRADIEQRLAELRKLSVFEAKEMFNAGAKVARLVKD